eukprot:GFYU01005737.1.p1 GENE.GFYU01005737.1~~GFYU01005737.1.p1  ORF type:complete len:638 (-),score=220.42 GFYU01005737.1:54-1697(-)
MVASFSKSFHGDVFLAMKLLLTGDDKRVYNLRDKSLMRVLSDVLGCSADRMIEHASMTGDCSHTAYKAYKKSSKAPETSTLTLAQLDKFLTDLTKATKIAEQVPLFRDILRKCVPEDLKWLCKIIDHDLKINIGAKFVLEAFHPDAYEAYKRKPDLRKILEQVQAKQKAGGKALSRKLSNTLEPMTPLKPMLAQPLKVYSHILKKCPEGYYCETKYDGERTQIHFSDGQHKFFSRTLKDIQKHKIADLPKYLLQAMSADSYILDTEIVLVNSNTGDILDFGTLGVHEMAKAKKLHGEVNVCLIVFDILMLNGESLLDSSMEVRRKKMEEHINVVPNHIVLSEAVRLKTDTELAEKMEDAIERGLEGLMMKGLKSTYKPGDRKWFKLKKDYLEGMADTCDLVVLGAYHGTGSKGGMKSTFLMGCYDDKAEQWKTVCKVGNGHDDRTLEKLQKKFADMKKISGDAMRVPSWLDVSRTLVPDFVVSDPFKSAVWEIAGFEYTKSKVHTADSISVRFPRVTRIRDDKGPKEANDLAYLKKLVLASKPAKKQ